jgi:hypothetical protein
MRVLNFCGLCIVGLVIAGACGGESEGTDEEPGFTAGETGTGEGGDSSSPGGNGSGPGGNGSGPGGSESVGGEASPTTGGRGGGSAGGSVGGRAAGGGSTVGGRATGGKGNPPVTGGVPGTGGTGGTAGEGTGGNCKPITTSSSLDSCSLELSCDDGYSYTSCYNQRVGNWYCECASRTGRLQTYEVTGVVGLAACQTISDLCGDGVPQIEGPEECLPQYESRATTYCDLQQRCTRSLAITEDVDAVVATYRNVSCSGVSAARMDCYCSNGLTLQVEGQDGTAACDTVLEICENPDIKPTGPEVCTTEQQGAGLNYCSSSLRCTQSLEVDGGVIGVTTGTRSANCTAADGGSVCDCFDQNNYLRFSSERSPDEIATCNDFAQNCTSVDELGLNGPLTCKPIYQQGDSQYCNVNVECSQAGSLGDEPIRAFGSVNGYCTMANGAWSCTCNSGIESAAVEVDADDGWAACTELIERCPDLVEVQIGQDGGIKPPLL